MKFATHYRKEVCCSHASMPKHNSHASPCFPCAHARLQAKVIQREATIQQLLEQKGELEKRFGIPIKDRKTGGCMRAWAA